MPQKIILERAPLMPLFQTGPGNGCILAEEPLLKEFYQHLNAYADHPEIWEGLAGLACLVSEHPEKEPVAAAIHQAAYAQKNGDFKGEPPEQLYIARALLAWNEFSPDKGDIRRLADWCRWAEADWDRIISCSRVRIQPADWMDFFLRLYRITGLKAILRLCVRLRTAAMDWTTVLHSFEKTENLQDSLVLDDPESVLFDQDLDESDYQKRQCIIHHAELLPDGMRYCTLSGLFSGNGQELSAGKKGWLTVKKHYGAVCGGTAGSPFLAVNGSNQPVSSASLSAWMEAFCTQLMTGDSEWALDEIIRIGFNGLADALRNPDSRPLQYLNILQQQKESAQAVPEELEVHTLSRISRAIVGLYRHAVTSSRENIRINYPLPGRFTFPEKKCIVTLKDDRVCFYSKDSVQADLMVYSSMTDSREIAADIDGQRYVSSGECSDEGQYFRLSGPLHSHDSVEYLPSGQVLEISTHHQGACFFLDNRLYALPVKDEKWQWAVCGKAETDEEGRVFVPLQYIRHWKDRDGLPADLPVLPVSEEEKVRLQLLPYPESVRRITVFPKVRG